MHGKSVWGVRRLGLMSASMLAGCLAPAFAQGAQQGPQDVSRIPPAAVPPQPAPGAALPAPGDPQGAASSSQPSGIDANASEISYKGRWDSNKVSFWA